MELLNEAERILLKNEYDVIEIFSSPCDLLAFNNDILAFKVLENIDGFNFKNAEELKRFANVFNARAWILGHHSIKENLMDGVIYFRHDIPCFNLNTLKGILRNNILPVYHIRGKYLVKIDSEKFRELCKDKGLSKHELSRRTNISLKSIIRYEKGDYASVEYAIKLEEILGDVFQKDCSLKTFCNFKEGNSEISKKLRDLSLIPVDFEKFFFNTIAHDYEDRFVVNENLKMRDEYLRVLKKLKELENTYPFIIVDKIKDIEFPQIERKDFFRIKDKDSLKEIVM